MSAIQAPPFALDAATLGLGDPQPLPAEQILEGEPATAERALWTSPDGKLYTVSPG